MSTSVIVAGARTPFGRLLGAFKDVSATHLGGFAIEAALKNAGIAPAEVDYLIAGQVLQAGCGQNPARTAGLKGGLEPHTPSITVNKVCLSGLNAIIQADQLIKAGDATVVVAGGMESMSNAPHLIPGSRNGFRYGDATVADHMAYDGLYDQATLQGMGPLAESWYIDHPETSRKDQDAFGVRSHRLAAEAAAAGRFDAEIVPVALKTRNGEPVTVASDEGIRPNTTADSLAALPPAFSTAGTITAATASQISDGAAFVVVMAKEAAEARGLPWMAEIVSNGQVAGPDSRLQHQPANATQKALDKAGLAVEDLDLVEFNEAFAVVGIESAARLGLDPDKVNVNGGALAIGHPLGASGARIVLHLALELQRRGGGVGAAALCGGGGQGDALIVRVPEVTG